MVFKSSRVVLSIPSLAGVGEWGLSQGNAEDSSRGHLLAFIGRFNNAKNFAGGLQEDHLFASMSLLSYGPSGVVIVAMAC